MEKTIEQQSEEIVEKFGLQPTSKTFDFIQGVLQERERIAREEERWRCKGIVANYLLPREDTLELELKNAPLREAMEDMDDPEQMPIGENGQYLTTPLQDNQPKP